LREGEDVTILATGTMVSRCIQAAETLEGQGIHAGVMGMWSVKPLDLELLLQAAKTTGALVTAEDHSIVGGFGSAVAEALASRYPVPIEMV
jgi:transketolase